MNIEFEKQSPVDSKAFGDFLVSENYLFKTKEPAKIFLVDTDCYKDEHRIYLEVTFLFANTDFDNPFIKLLLVGKSKTDGINDLIKIKNNHMLGYEFIRSLLIADGLMDKKCYDSITLDVMELKNYLTSKEIIFDGIRLENKHIDVIEVC